MKKITLIPMLFLCFSMLFAQEKKSIKFVEEIHDFGKLKEEQGKADFEFKFNNNGAVAIKLTDVKASCGCTTPQWTNEDVLPGKTGSINASYSTTNRPGPFTKTITVKALPKDGVEEIHVLTIKGEVIPKVKGPADWYPTQMGSLRGTTNHFAFGKIFNSEKKELKAVIYNETDKPVTIKGFDVTPNKHITLRVDGDKKVINSKDSVVVLCTYDAKMVDDWGFIHTQAKMLTDDANTPEKVIYVSAERTEKFTIATKEDSLKAPKIVFDKITYDWGTIKQGAKVPVDYKFTNTGKSDLIIRKTKASCGCTASNPEKTLLKPGESSNIKVNFDSTGKKGNESKTITIISNDPVTPSIVLTIKGIIEVPGETTPNNGTPNK